MAIKTKQRATELVDAATQKLLDVSGGFVSSQDTGIEEAISKAITGIEKGREAGTARVESIFERAKLGALTAGGREFTTAEESRRGFATNQGLLKLIADTTETELKDLEQRKQELILAGEAEAARQISTLQIQSLQFKQESQQRTFTNLLSLAGLEIQKGAATREERRLTIQEDQSISNIALEFGLDIREDDTIASITERAKEGATEKRKLELDKIRADIERTKAETAKVLRGEDAIFTPEVIESIAIAANSNPAVLGLIKDPKAAAKIITKMEELNSPRVWSLDELEELIDIFETTGTPFREALAEIAIDPRIKNKDEAENILRARFGREDTGGLFGKVFTQKKQKEAPEIIAEKGTLLFKIKQTLKSKADAEAKEKEIKQLFKID